MENGNIVGKDCDTCGKRSVRLVPINDPDNPITQYLCPDCITTEAEGSIQIRMKEIENKKIKRKLNRKELFRLIDTLSMLSDSDLNAMMEAIYTNEKSFVRQLIVAIVNAKDR